MIRILDISIQNALKLNGSLKGIILWENPNPSSPFSSQDVTLSTADYDIMDIFYKVAYSDNRVLRVSTLKGIGGILFSSCGLAGSVVVQDIRNFSCKSDTLYSFDNGKRLVFTNPQYSDNNNSLVPIKIIGYKI